MLSLPLHTPVPLLEESFFTYLTWEIAEISSSNGFRSRLCFWWFFGSADLLHTKRRYALNRLLKIVPGLLLLGMGGGLLIWGRSERLPRIPLRGGGEFCVVKICYGPDEVHRLGGSPRPVLWIWKRLPSSLQERLPAPTYGDTAVSPGEHRKALSIYWTWIDPKTGKHELGPSGDVILTTDSGEQMNLTWPDPFDDINGNGYRQIFVHEPPRDSRFLRFHVPVEDEAVDFTIANPAFRKP